MEKNLSTGGKYSTADFGKILTAIDITLRVEMSVVNSAYLILEYPRIMLNA